MAFMSYGNGLILGYGWWDALGASILLRVSIKMSTSLSVSIRGSPWGREDHYRSSIDIEDENQKSRGAWSKIRLESKSQIWFRGEEDFGHPRSFNYDIKSRGEEGIWLLAAVVNDKAPLRPWIFCYSLECGERHFHCFVGGVQTNSEGHG